VGDDRRRTLALDRAHLLAQRVVRPRGERLRLVEVASGPGLDAGVDVERVDVAAQPDQVGGGHVDRQVDDEAPGGDRLQHLAVVIGPQRDLAEAHALELAQAPARVVRVDHHHLVAGRPDVAQDQRQGALADRAEADDDDGPVVVDLGGKQAHDYRSPVGVGRRRRPSGREPAR
jgi:hypothetical protein